MAAAHALRRTMRHPCRPHLATRRTRSAAAGGGGNPKAEKVLRGFSCGASSRGARADDLLPGLDFWPV
jgi:hypothetical protein